MKSVDYIIVGVGLSGIALVQKLLENKHSFVVFDAPDACASATDASLGFYNPVVLKRFTAVWQAQPKLDLLHKVYAYFERRYQQTYLKPIPTYRLFASPAEQQAWTAKSEQPSLVNFLAPKFQYKQYRGISAPLGFGAVKGVGRLDVQRLKSDVVADLKRKDAYSSAYFDYDVLKVEKESVLYKGYRAKRIVFCEGLGLKNNPFFKELPLKGTKGEWMTVKIPDLSLDVMIKSALFLCPLTTKGHYAVGATFDWHDKTAAITHKARAAMVQKLRKFMKLPFEVIDQKAGIRPTVSDRRPLVGRHATHQNLFVLNGLGTRGVMTAPYVADKLYRLMEKSEPLPKEIVISRF